MDGELEHARQRMQNAMADLRQTNKWVAACASRMRQSRNTADYQHYCGEAIVATEESRVAAIVLQDAVEIYLALFNVQSA